MAYEITKDLEQYVENSVADAHALLKTLCQIPAPSHQEEKRAEFIKNWLEREGAAGVSIDEAKNVIFAMNSENCDEFICFAAHTDTVFPMDTPLTFTQDEENFYCPGVGDDTACLAILLLTIRYILRRGLQPKTGILFVANACEEGLGNLKGTRQLFKDYEGRISRFYTLDGQYTHLVNRSVGSHRYSIEAKTQGGHSFSAFGNANAIAELAKLISDLYTVQVPKKDGCKTTYNVGAIEGGTSVNTIAQSARMLYEYRSDDAESLAIMEKIFFEKVENARKEGVSISVETVGIRPCGEARDKKAHDAMTQRVIEICERTSGLPCTTASGSTDCNIPLSLGIPAVCAGVYLGKRSHTREESVKINSLPVGMKIGAQIILDYFV